VEDASPAANALEQANAEYLEGVRSYVREDYRSAETHFHHVQETLAFAGSEEAASLDARDAETLLAKAEYFLEKISENGYASTPETPPTGEETQPTTTPGWEVTYGSITPIRNRDVDRWMEYFLGDGRAIFQKWLDRKATFDPVFRATLSRHHLPPQLVWHSMIESGYSPNAYSWAHAVGLWQFVLQTGRRYGLRSDWWVDERRDPARASEAAATYLTELYTEFQDWELALAAYNVGEGRVRKQIARQDTRDFWKLHLPRETMNHIPKVYAAALIGSEPERYGFSAPHAEPVTPDSITVTGCVDFQALGECAGVDPYVIADLNPALVRRCTPPDEERWTVYLPAGTSERAKEALASLPEDRRVRWAHHAVRRGETLSRIAGYYATTVEAIVEANRLQSRHRVSVGQELLIPQGRSSGANAPRVAFVDADAVRSPRSRATSSPAPSSSTPATGVYTVRRGDTLSTIAQRYGTSTGQLRRMNRIGRHIFPGQRIKVPSRERLGHRTEEARLLRVQPGDTLWTIAQAHGVSVADLLRANDLGRDALIRTGQTLRLPR
jgi:membrane-bound lytic murein transglycosylase D